MKTYTTDAIRNVGIVGHGDTGKTQLVSSLLFTAGMTPRFGKVNEGSTVTDWDEEEIARKISIQTAVAFAEWQAPGAADKIKINLLDTPGYSTFVNETKASLIAADAALILVDAAAGRSGGHRKSLGFRHRIRHPPRVRPQLDGSRAGQLRALHEIAAGCLRPRRSSDSIAYRPGEKFQRRDRSHHHASAHLHARRRRQSQGRRNSRRDG